MADVKPIDLSFYVGQPDHLAIAEGINRQPEHPLEYANDLLQRVELEPLGPEDFNAGVRRLIRVGVLVRRGKTLEFTSSGRQALEMYYQSPWKRSTASSRGAGE